MTKNDGIARLRLPVYFIAALAMVSGCSSYSGEKLGIIDQKSVVPSGIPYTLVRAEYSLSRTPPADGEKLPTYTIGVSYEADPKQTYTLKINPGVFADPNFIVKLAASGTLQGTTATFTEQITPTITALGSFAKDLISAMAIVGDEDSVRKAIKFYLTGPPCLGPTDVLRPPPPPAVAPTVAAVMKARIDAFKNDDEFGNLFHYITEKERQCLVDSKSKLDSSVTTTQQLRIEEWEKEQANYLNANPEERSFVDRLTRAVAAEDTKMLAAIQKEISEEKGSAGDPTRRAQARNGLLSKAGPAAAGNSEIRARAKLTFFINMDLQTWRGRHLIYLEREIDAATLLVLRRSDASGTRASIDNYLDLLRRQRAATIGASDLYEWSLTLSKFLENIKNKSVEGGKAPATAEYATARAQLDTVLTQIDARRTRVLADAKPPPPPPAAPLKAIDVKRVTQEEINKSLASGWIAGDGAKAPEYVLVLEEMP